MQTRSKTRSKSVRRRAQYVRLKTSTCRRKSIQQCLANAPRCKVTNRSAVRGRYCRHAKNNTRRG